VASSDAVPGRRGDSSSGADGSSSGSSAEGPPSGESAATPPIPSTVIFPYDRFRELLEQPPGRSRPAGLRNIGNTCFANSLLQPLMATQPLMEYLLSGEHSAGCSKGAGGKDFCLLCDLEALAKQAHSAGSSTAVLEPRQILRCVAGCSRMTLHCLRLAM
jgi:ubiquitin carboxyl-terminal hydrolase 36/42